MRTEIEPRVPLTALPRDILFSSYTYALVDEYARYMEYGTETILTSCVT